MYNIYVYIYICVLVKPYLILNVKKIITNARKFELCLLGETRELTCFVVLEVCRQVNVCLYMKTFRRS